MSIEIARKYLKEIGYEDRILEFDESSATVELAARAVGVEEARIAKTLSFWREGGCILILAAGDARIDNAKFKGQFGMKARMLAAEDVEKETNHAIGGVCPFGVPDTALVYTDISLKRFDEVYPAAGNSASAVRLDCDELYAASKSLGWIDVCKNWQ